MKSVQFTVSYYFSLCNTSFYSCVVYQIMWGKEIFPRKLSKYRRYLYTFCKRRNVVLPLQFNLFTLLLAHKSNIFGSKRALLDSALL